MNSQKIQKSYMNSQNPMYIYIYILTVKDVSQPLIYQNNVVLDKSNLSIPLPLGQLNIGV